MIVHHLLRKQKQKHVHLYVYSLNALRYSYHIIIQNI